MIIGLPAISFWLLLGLPGLILLILLFDCWRIVTGRKD